VAAKERPSFLKKRSKKLLSLLASAFPDGLSPDSRKLFGSFFQKRTASFLHPIALAAILAVSSAHAQPPSQDPDWPCFQRLVPKLEPGSYWAGPPVPPAGAWRDDPAVMAIVTDVTDRDITDAESAEKLKAFLDTLPAAERAARAPALFSAIVEQTNDERGELIGRIEQLSRRQRALSSTISDLSAKADAAPAARRDDLNGQRDFTIRAFQESQRTMRYACEAPANMDRRLGVLARVLSPIK
jgi:hypothetical protein